MSLPDLVVHCDWGKDPNKRWMALARRSDRSYAVSAPELVGDAREFLGRLRGIVGRSSTIVVGFDFPIGIPAAYALRADVSNFERFLPKLGHHPWSHFYEVARFAEEISIQRPFYPFAHTGSPRQVDLVNGLGLDHPSQLYRLCERPHARRRNSACPLFWTLGSNQVGRAAIAGWQEVLCPAVAQADGDIRLWPFNGTLAELISKPGIVIAETYPAEAYHWLDVKFSSDESKRKQADRRRRSDQLISWADRKSLRLADKLEGEIRDGFGPREAGEDPFDAVIGLFGMLEVALGTRPEGRHPDPVAARVEGWILGQTDHP